MRIVVGAAALLMQYELRATPAGLALGLGSAVLAALFGVLNGKLARHEQPERLMFYELAAAWLVVSAFMPFQWVVPSTTDLGLADRARDRLHGDPAGLDHLRAAHAVAVHRIGHA